MKRALLLAGLACAPFTFAAPALAAPEQLTLTPADMVSATISHAVVMSITGTFTQLAGTLTFDEDTKGCTVDVTFQVGTMQLPALVRPQVMAKSFLDPADYPTMRYTGTCQGKTLVGNLTMHGETHPLNLAITYLYDSSNKLTGFDAAGSLDRTQWGVNGLPLLVGKNIKVVQAISLNGQTPTIPQS